MGLDTALGVAMVLLVVAAAVVSLWLARVDWLTGRLPNRLVGGLLLVTVGLAVFELIAESRAGCRLVDVGGVCSSSGSSTAATMLLSGAGFGGPLLLLNLVSPVSVGFGDVKLALVLGSLLGVRGWSVLSSGVAVGVGALLVGMSAALVFRRGEKSAPLGPGLVVGAWLVFAVVAVGG